MRRLDPDDVFHRAARDLASLDAHEQLVAGVQLLELLAAKDGWDEFFTSSYFALYPAMRAGLAAAGDAASLRILDDYEQWLRANGVALDPKAIASFAATLDEASLRGVHDPEPDFAAIADERWRLIERYLASQGVHLQSGGPDELQAANDDDAG